jgi:cytochrome c oxidase assembly protein subunit 15
MHAPSADSLAPGAEPRTHYRWPLYRYACFCAGSVLFLICLGGLVTSHEAGMSVPDWPNSYGYNMFLFPWQDWVGGIFFEHSHRLVASGVGVLLSILAIALCFQERVWLRWMALAVPVFVALEGTLGGLRVVLREDQIGIFHGCLAQALLLAGATMRHEHAGLSIPDFPLAYGQVWPRTDPASVAAYNRWRLEHEDPATTPLYINMQMAHRVGAVLVTVAILAASASAWRTPGTAPILRRWTAGWVALVFIQFTLGALTIWTNKAADVATTHVAVGALTLLTGALLTAMSWRLKPRAALQGAE